MSRLPFGRNWTGRFASQNGNRTGTPQFFRRYTKRVPWSVQPHIAGDGDRALSCGRPHQQGDWGTDEDQPKYGQSLLENCNGQDGLFHAIWNRWKDCRAAFPEYGLPMTSLKRDGLVLVGNSAVGNSAVSHSSTLPR